MFSRYVNVLEEPIKTLKGSKIARYKGEVGKAMGSQIYFHKDYAEDIIPADLLKLVVEKLKENFPEFEFNCMMYDRKKNIVRFDEGADFDERTEPMVGWQVAVSREGEVAKSKNSSKAVWHHKWLWVRDDYKGFDVEESKEWSRYYLAKLDETTRGGSRDAWHKQLHRFGLLDEYKARNKE